MKQRCPGAGPVRCSGVVVFEGKMPAVTICAQLVVTNGVTCDTCGRPVAKYTNHRKPGRPVEWGHLRGSPKGTVPKHRILLAEAKRALDEVERQLQIANAIERYASRLDRIEAMLAELLARPATIQWKPDHRRQADGGVSVRKQRREAGVSQPRRGPVVVERSVGAVRQAAWRERQRA